EGIAQHLSVVGQGPAAAVAGGASGLDLEQRVEVLGAYQGPGELQRQRQTALMLVRPGTRQAEAGDLLVSGLQLLAADAGQLAAGIAPASARQQRRQHDSPHPTGAEPATCCNPHTPSLAAGGSIGGRRS